DRAAAHAVGVGDRLAARRAAGVLLPAADDASAADGVRAGRGRAEWSAGRRGSLRAGRRAGRRGDRNGRPDRRRRERAWRWGTIASRGTAPGTGRGGGRARRPA